MMRVLTQLSSFSLLATLATGLNITVPSAIKAGEEVQVTVGFDFWKQHYEYETTEYMLQEESKPVCRNAGPEGCSYDMLWEHYQLYFFTQDFMTICALTEILKTGKTDPKIVIPKDLAPARDDYQINVIEFNGTDMYMPDKGVANSSFFSLTGTSLSDWTRWEKADGDIQPFPNIPCSSYPCFRKCGVKFSDEDGYLVRDSASDMFACFDGCPGINVNLGDVFWDWLAHGETITGLSATSTAASTVQTDVSDLVFTTEGEATETEDPSSPAHSAAITPSASDVEPEPTNADPGAVSNSRKRPLTWLITLAWICINAF